MNKNSHGYSLPSSSEGYKPGARETFKGSFGKTAVGAAILSKKATEQARPVHANEVIKGADSISMNADRSPNA